jgi:hypothetical protein
MAALYGKNMIFTFLKWLFEFTDFHTRCEGCGLIRTHIYVWFMYCVQSKLVYLYIFFGLAVENTKNFKKNSSLSVMQQPDITPGPLIEQKSHYEV